jgi:hypothetical protein
MTSTPVKQTTKTYIYKLTTKNSGKAKISKLNIYGSNAIIQLLSKNLTYKLKKITTRAPGGNK